MNTHSGRWGWGSGGGLGERTSTPLTRAMPPLPSDPRRPAGHNGNAPCAASCASSLPARSARGLPRAGKLWTPPRAPRTGLLALPAPPLALSTGCGSSRPGRPCTEASPGQPARKGTGGEAGPRWRWAPGEATGSSDIQKQPSRATARRERAPGKTTNHFVDHGLLELLIVLVHLGEAPVPAALPSNAGLALVQPVQAVRLSQQAVDLVGATGGAIGRHSSRSARNGVPCSRTVGRRWEPLRCAGRVGGASSAECRAEFAFAQAALRPGHGSNRQRS